MISIHGWPYFFFVIIAALGFACIEKGKSSRSLALSWINFLLLSLLFLNEKKHFVVLLLFLVGNYSLSQAMLRYRHLRSWIFVAQFFLILGTLCAFKYSWMQNFVVDSFPKVALQLLIPLQIMGISFFCFRVLSVSIDILYGEIEKICFSEYFSFAGFFATFVSGPLDRYSRFHEDLEKKQDLQQLFWGGWNRIALGLFKKNVLADSLYPLCIDSIHPLSGQGLAFPKLALANTIYLFVLYFDFSGYCDIAIGVSRLFGIHTPENFQFPFLARNLQDFWNRWHITLMAWFRDYLFFPLQRLAQDLKIRNATVIVMFGSAAVFVCAGIWHGDGKQYLFYGFYHAICAVLYIAYKQVLKASLDPHTLVLYQNSALVRWSATAFTLLYFWCGLFFFTGHYYIFSRLTSMLGD